MISLIQEKPAQVESKKEADAEDNIELGKMKKEITPPAMIVMTEVPISVVN